MQKIMFNDAYGLTQAVLDGRKTMTRRLISPRLTLPADERNFDEAAFKELCCAFAAYKLGEVVAVAQRYADIPGMEDMSCTPSWRNKMFVKADMMPHRIRITGMRVERLQDISDADCIKEGIRRILPDFSIQQALYEGAGLLWPTPRAAFAHLINKVSGRGTWASNPWVVVYEFEMIK